MRHVSFVAASLLIGGCSALVSFDRSRIDGGSGIDGGMVDAGDGGGLCEVGSNNGCANDALCCTGTGGPECQATGPTQCAECGMGCEPNATSGCVDRVCSCGTNPECTGATPFCDDAAGECVECRDDGDCDGASSQCVDGSCEECDPDDNSGCSGNTPICNSSNSCEACTVSGMCPGTLDCQASGECGCMNDAQCTTPTTPICDNGDRICVGCANATECMDAGAGNMCLSDGSCADCNPDNNDGCSGRMPICRRTAGVAACAACAVGDCGSLASTPACALMGANSGACVECIDDTTCSGDVCDTSNNVCIECDGNEDCGGTTPICMANTCVGCTSDGQCGGMFCVTTGGNMGACATCDPSDNGGCSGTTPICAANGSSCGPCTMNAQCSPMFCQTSGATMGACGACDPADNDGCGPTSTTPVCGAGATCTGCTMDAQCTAIMAGTVCVESGARDGACGECDPMEGDADCPGETCNAATAMCEPLSGCMPACSGSTPICVGTTCRACDPADDSGCMGAQVCRGSDFTCVDCEALTDCGHATDGVYECDAGRCLCNAPGVGCTCDDDNVMGGGVSCPNNDRCLRDIGSCVNP